MKTIERDEFYQNVCAFMKSKGIELTDGAYAGHIRRGCGLLSDAINAAQRAVTRAKKEVDSRLSRLRQCIHDATAESGSSPAPAATAPAAAAPATDAKAAADGKSARKPGARGARKAPSAAKSAPAARRPRRAKPSS